MFFFFSSLRPAFWRRTIARLLCVCVWCCWLYTNAAGLWYSSLKYWTPPLACCRLVRLLCSLLAEEKKKTLLPSHNFLRPCAHFVFWIHSRPNRSPRLITSNYSQEMRRRISYSQFFGFFSIGGGISFQCLYASKKKKIYLCYDNNVAAFQCACGALFFLLWNIDGEKKIVSFWTGWLFLLTLEAFFFPFLFPD